MSKNRQLGLWETQSRAESKRNDIANGIGPFRIQPDEVSEWSRKFDCPTYDTCLMHAACRSWESFTCIGCFKRPCQKNKTG